jgi:predicted nucleotidyltransferase component of viral defense system
MISPYNERKVHNSELLQVILLDSIYSTSGSQNVIFQGGTALRWIYSGMRFSEDLDFVTNLSISKIESILKKAFRKADRASILQFGPGTSEISRKESRQGSIKLFYIFRPQAQKERIAVKIEFEPLKKSILPETLKTVLRDLPSVSGLTAMGKLIMPYSSSIIISENPDELLSDKIRALYERSYIKGRDIFDIWWLSVHMKISPSWDIVSKKLRMYPGSL